MEKLDKVIAGLTSCNNGSECELCAYRGQREGDKTCLDLLTEDALAWLKEQNRLIEELSDHIPCCDNCEGKTVIGERTDKCVYEIEGFDSVIYCAKRGIANCFGYRKKIRELEEKLEQTELTLEVTRQNLGDTREELNRKTQSEFYESLKRGLEEAVAYEKGEIDLPTKTLSTDGDLISRSVLIEEVKCLCGNWFHGYQDAITHVVEEIEAAPAVEAEPVVHAHWVLMKQRPVGGRHLWYCSACGQHGDIGFERCPGCGAHMDEEVAHE